MEPLVAPTLERWLTAGFRAREPERTQAVARMIRTTPPGGYAGCCAALAAADTRPLLATIACPTLVLVGEHDQGTPLAMAQLLQQSISGSRLQVIGDAAHLSSVEQPDAFNQALDAFIDSTRRA
jgi:3-oxoadipate enol-lactonase